MKEEKKKLDYPPTTPPPPPSHVTHRLLPLPQAEQRPGWLHPGLGGDLQDQVERVRKSFENNVYLYGLLEVKTALQRVFLVGWMWEEIMKNK